VLWAAGAGLLLLLALVYYASLPVAEVAPVQRGTAISAVYGSVRIEPTEIVRVRAQNSGIIRLADPYTSGRAAIGRAVQKGDLFATIADEITARQLEQARNDLQAGRQRAQLPLPSSEPLRVAEDSVNRLERLTNLSNVPAVDYEKAKSEVTRLRGLLEAERIERDRNLENLEAVMRKLESQMRNSEIRAPMDGLLTGIKAIDGEVVAEGNELFTVSSKQNYLRGEVNEEDVGEVKIGLSAIVQVYAYRGRQFNGTVAAIIPAADPETQRYTVNLELKDPPDNLLAGMTGEMNIITGRHENALLVPTRALLVDQALVVNGGVVQKRTVNIGFRTLEISEALSGLNEGEHVILADQDRFRPGAPVRSRVVKLPTR
jgi:RND family efflux transporter MFP subunit